MWCNISYEKEMNKKELKDIFNKMKDSDETALEQLYQKYGNLVYGIAFGILKNKEDSEDTVQNVFCKLYKMDKEKLPSDKEACWLYTLSKNEAISLYRRKNEDVDLDSIYEIEENNNEIDKSIDILEFNRLINSLNEKEKQLISLKILSELSFDEIAKFLNEPVGTIKWRYYKSLHSLKLLFSNLCMFIITFVIGIKALHMKTKVSQTETENKADSEVNPITNNMTDETKKSELQESLKDETNINNEVINETHEEIHVIPNETEQINYGGIGILSISMIFLILTIFFTIIFKKYQLKRKNKTSK